MKKTLFAALALFAGLTLVSCDPEDLRNVIDSLSGNADLVVTCQDENYYANGQEVNFSTCASDYVITDSGDICNVFLGANINFVEDVPESIEAPFLGLRLTDTVCGTYDIQNIVTKENIAYLDPARLLNQVVGTNIFVIAACDTVAYLSKSGSVELTAYPTMGNEAKATLTNVQAYYAPKSKVMYVRDLIEAADNGDINAAAELSTLDLEALFPLVTFNGTISARRMPVESLLEKLEIEEDAE